MSAAQAVTATFTLIPYTLTVAKAGTGSGTVTSSPAGISCGADCSEPYNSGTVVTLSQAATAGSTFAGWSGACTGTGACSVTMSAAQAVTATFNLIPYTLTVAKAGTGAGTVTSSPAGISCGADCSEPYNSGTVVTLSQAATAGSTFAGWSGACTGTGACSVTMSAAQAVTATFNLNPCLHPDRREGGNRQPAPSPPLPPASAAANRLLRALQLRHRRHPQPGRHRRLHLRRLERGLHRNRRLLGHHERRPVRHRHLQPQSPTPSPSRRREPAAGTVTSSPAGISCGADCSEPYNSGTVVTLSQAATAGSTFAGWSGACTGTGACSVTMSAAQSVTATFNLNPTYTLTVAKAGTGAGTVTSSPAGISCGADCSEPYNSGTVVTLSQAATAGSTFAGWSGACTGTGACSVTMSAAQSVTATFNLPSPTPSPSRRREPAAEPSPPRPPASAAAPTAPSPTTPEPSSPSARPPPPAPPSPAGAEPAPEPAPARSP